MRQTGPLLAVGAPKTVSWLAIIFLVTAACFGFLNSQKLKTLRADVAAVAIEADGIGKLHT